VSHDTGLPLERQGVHVSGVQTLSVGPSYAEEVCMLLATVG
jgi:hypothetical protein